MPPAERALESATLDHVALSVGQLDAMVAFYTALGFDEVARTDFAPAPVRLVTLTNHRGSSLEITVNDHSQPVPPSDPIAASRRRGPFHFALRVKMLDEAVNAAVDAGARLVTGPSTNSRGDLRFAYIADPEDNLIELVSLPTEADGSRNIGTL